MKLALIGDIHANYCALQTVLSAAISNGVDTLLVTGDLVGYYFEPVEVLKLLDPWNKYVVKGNHENMLRVARADHEYLAQVDLRYGTGLRIAVEQLSTKQIDGLCDLPHPLELELGGCRIMLCHGSPWDIDCYLYPDSNLELLINYAKSHFDFIILGHTHYTMWKRIGHLQIVNPGSVGQPRNKQPGAHWVLLDTNTRKIEFHCEYYDSSRLVLECRNRHLNLPYLADVLMRIN